MAPGSARGFTLVELLVVILILTALVLIAIPRYFQAVYGARVRGCQANIQTTSTAAEAFFARNRTWPTEVDDMVEGVAPSWVVSPPLTERPECPFGVPYELALVLRDGTVGGAPTLTNPQVGVTLNTWDHFEGSWKTAEEHR